MSSPSSRPTGSNMEEYKIFKSNSSRKSFQVMKFHQNVDFVKWRQAELQRENNSKLYETEVEELPEFGKGSEFGRKERESAKRKRFQKISETYNPNEQPWILKTYAEESQEYHSQIQGGISDNAAYYVLTQIEGGLEAHPIKEWYTFQRKNQLKTFTTDDVEEQFNKRNNYTNYFSLVKRMRSSRIAEEQEEQTSKKKKKSNSESDESSDEECAKTKKVAKRKKRRFDDEAVEESDDGDGEGNELDYISSGESDNEKEDLTIVGVAEEKAIRQILDSDEDDSEEEIFQDTSRVQNQTQELLCESSKSLGNQQSNKTKESKTLPKTGKTNNSNGNFQKFKKPVFTINKKKFDGGTKKKNL